MNTRADKYKGQANNRSISLSRPFFDNEEIDAVKRVLDSGWLVQGREVEALENKISDMHQREHCIAVSSGTAALHICFLSLEIGAGDVIFVPSFAWPSAANMAVLVGARPVLVDVLPSTYNIDPVDLRVKIKRCIDLCLGTPRAIVPVHLFGLAAEMVAILQIAEEYNLEVVEDAACALGTNFRDKPVGTFGKLAIFSFHPRKSITTGEGGAIVTNDGRLAELCRMWRNHGQTYTDGTRQFLVPGLNYRMTEIQAAIGLAQLDKFPKVLESRRYLVEGYFEELVDCPGLILPIDDPEHTWQTFMVVLQSANQNTVISNLASQGIEVGQGSVAAHDLALYRKQYGYSSVELPVSHELSTRGLALPLHPQIDRTVVTYVARALRSQLNKSL
jgi:dTDP-4-amino-4,6-dideoxygalactose transaminase